jgi:uncharacterized protein involved in exopolysaccharide biosynthesis
MPVELRGYYEIARRHWRTLLVGPLLAACVALAATFLVAPRYDGVATVQLIPDSFEPRTVTLRSEDGPDTVALGLANPTELLAQGVIENLGSRPVAEAIVDELALDQLPEPTGFNALKAQVRAWIGDALTLMRYGYVVRVSKREAMIGAIQGAVEAELVRGSYYMHISTTWSNPEAAADISNAAVRALTAHTRRVASESAAEQSRFLEQRVAEARANMNQARAAMVQYSQLHGVVGGESLRLALDQLERAREDLRRNSLATLEASRQLAEVQRQLGITTPTVTSSTAEEGQSVQQPATNDVTGLNPLFLGMHERVSELEQEVAALEVRGGMTLDQLRAANEADLATARRRLEIAQGQQKQSLSALVKDQVRETVLTLEQEVAALQARGSLSERELRAANEAALYEARRRLDIARQQLAGANPVSVTTDRTAGGGGYSSGVSRQTAPNPVYQSLQEQGMRLEQQLTSLRAQRPELEAAAAGREQEMRNLAANDGELAALAQDLALAGDLYNRRTTQWYDALLEENRPVSQVRLVDPAVAPLYPRQPVKVLWTLIGAAAGLAAAVVLVFVRHATDISLRTARETADALGLDLLAVVPATNGHTGARANGTTRGRTE